MSGMHFTLATARSSLEKLTVICSAHKAAPSGSMLDDVGIITPFAPPSLRLHSASLFLKITAAALLALPLIDRVCRTFTWRETRKQPTTLSEAGRHVRR